MGFGAISEELTKYINLVVFEDMHNSESINRLVRSKANAVDIRVCSVYQFRSIFNIKINVDLL